VKSKTIKSKRPRSKTNDSSKKVFILRQRLFPLNSFALLCLSIVFFCSVLSAQAPILFTNIFNTDPPLASSQTTGAWYPDRYPPTIFEEYNFSGENVLHIGVRLADAYWNRPLADQRSFCNTQGRKYDLGSGNSFNTALIADLYVGADWNTKHRMATLWSTACDSTGASSFFNYLGFRNTTGSNPGFYVYGYHNIGAYTLLPFTITYGQWYSLKIELTDTAFVYYINGTIVLSDSTLNGTKYFSNLMLQASNFADSTLPAENQAFEDYDVYWDNVGAINTALPLPVELTNFSSSIKQSTVLLQWKTATETNNYGFELERRQVSSSQPLANSWQKIGFVAGAGTSNSPHEYSYSDNVLSPGRYVYRIKQIDHNGLFKYYGNAEVEIMAPAEYALEQNFPNPFNPATTFSFSLPSASFVILKIFDVRGREVSVVLSEELSAGKYSRQWNTLDLPSGDYFYRLQAGSFTETKKLLLLK
jgi:hypothetical protein